MGSDPPGRSDDDEGIVRPEDLDFTRDERVAEIETGRYVVGTDATSPPDPEAAAERKSDPTPAQSAPSDERTPGELLGELADELAAVDEPHGFAIAARFDGEVDRRAILADDLADMFEDLLSWAAAGIDDEAPREAILGALLAASGQTVRFPDGAFEALLAEYDLRYDDSIGDLAERVADEGFRVPPPDADGE